MNQTIGQVAAETGVSVRTLRYYEELGLLKPSRDTGGRRLYDANAISQLYRVRLLRALGTPLAEVRVEHTDLQTLTRSHLVDVDRQVAELLRHRERVRTVDDRLVAGDPPTDAELVSVLTGLSRPDGEFEPELRRRLTLLIYRDLVSAQRFLVGTFGLRAGPVTVDPAGRVVHAEVFAGDGVIWLHPESEDLGLASPQALGGAAHCMAIDVPDVDAHFDYARAAGAEIVYEPELMPYGVREYGARDSEGGLWSFMQAVVAGE